MQYRLDFEALSKPMSLVFVAYVWLRIQLKIFQKKKRKKIIFCIWKNTYHTIFQI